MLSEPPMRRAAYAMSIIFPSAVTGFSDDEMLTILSVFTDVGEMELSTGSSDYVLLDDADRVLAQAAVDLARVLREIEALDARSLVPPERLVDDPAHAAKSLQKLLFGDLGVDAPFSRRKSEKYMLVASLSRTCT